MAFRLIDPAEQFFDNTGNVLAGGKMHFYQPGTTTNKATYTDQTLASTNSNPVTLDSAGRAAVSIWGSGKYRVVVSDSTDSTTYVDIDPLSLGAASVNFSQAGTGAILSTVQPKLRERISLLDFLSGSDVRTALVNAIAQANAMGGATIHIPGRSSMYTLTNTSTTGPILIPYDGIQFEGDGAKASIIRNNSVDQTDFFRFTGTLGRDFMGFRHLKLESGPSAGHIFSFESGTNHTGLGKGSHFLHLHLLQENLGKSIMRRSESDNGIFDVQFRGGFYDHGTAMHDGTPADAGFPTVPAFDIEGTVQNLNTVVFEDLRLNCHFGQILPVDGAAFLSFRNNAPSTGPYNTGIIVRNVNFEFARRGAIYLTGAANFKLSDITFYDSETIDGHLIETNNGSGTGGGKECDQGMFQDIHLKAGTPVGDARSTAVTVNSLMWANGVVSATCASAHGLAVGQRVYVSGANQAGYNGRFTVLTISGGPPETVFTYSVPTNPGAATGTITAAPAAMLVKLGPNDTNHTFINVGGANAVNAEVDLNDRACLVAGDHPRVVYARAQVARTTVIGMGASGNDARVETPLIRTDKIEARTAGGLVAWAPEGYLHGLEHIWVSATQVRIGPGSCRSDDNTLFIRTTSNITMAITTSGVNGLDTGSEAASTWYSVWIIADSTGVNAVAGLLSASASSPTMPTGYDKKRRVGWTYNDTSSNFRKFSQRGKGPTRTIWWDDTENNLRKLTAGSATTLTDVVMTDLMPPSSTMVHLLVGFTPATAGNKLTLIPTGFTAANWQQVAGIVAGVLQRSRITMPTSIAQRVAYSVTNASDDAWTYTLGYDDDL